MHCILLIPVRATVLTIVHRLIWISWKLYKMKFGQIESLLMHLSLRVYALHKLNLQSDEANSSFVWYVLSAFTVCGRKKCCFIWHRILLFHWANIWTRHYWNHNTFCDPFCFIDRKLHFCHESYWALKRAYLRCGIERKLFSRWDKLNIYLWLIYPIEETLGQK